MQTLENLRRKIQTATDLGSVVTTMKTLAAVSIRQYEQAAEALDDYSRTIELAFRIALARPPRSFRRSAACGAYGRHCVWNRPGNVRPVQ